ncbi:cell envelope integrity TolA C-terminal domain-containing protein, partial [Escherichia coli]
ADRNRSHWSTSKTPSYTKSVSWQHHQECTLRMHMAPNGLLLEVKRESGDLDLCREAMNAIKNADIPAPPSPEVYKVFQNGVLDFKP